MADPVFAEVNGNSVQYYIAITITNGESSATPSPFQQQITIDSDSYSSYLASGLSNVNFQDGSGNIIDSWLESGNSNTSTSTIYWVSLANGIGANSSVTIYYCIYATTVNAFNTTNTGVAPQLTSTYAQYDDGASVFPVYYNLAGTTLDSRISTLSGVTLTQNNGLSLAVTTTSTTFYVLTTSQITSPAILEVDETYYGVGTGTNPNEQYGLVIDSNTSTSQNTGGLPGGTNYMARIINNAGVSPQINNGGTTLASGTLNYTSQYTAIDSFIQTPSGLSATFDGTTTSASTTALTSGYLGFYIYSGSANSNVAFVQWLRTRAYPPNGAMPSVTFGSAQSITINIPSSIEYYVPINITNSQTSSTSSPFQQMVNITESNYAQYITYNSNFANFEYFYANGTVIPAWIESNQSGKLITWIKINPSIPASGKLTVYLGFASTSANLLSSSGTSGIGEASQLSSTYGEYDDIGSVMQPGLIYQVYYYSTGTCSSSSYQNNVYGATLGDGVTISSCASFVSSTNPFVTSQAGTTQNVDGTNQPNVVINYQEGYSGGIAYPNPPVSNNAYSWIIKTIGFADLPNQNINFYGLSDDGIAMGYNTNSGSSNGQYWLGGTSNPNNIYNGWHDQGATQYNGIVSPGTYAIEQDYYENGGGAYTALWSNITVNYYHAAYPPSGTMPSVSFGSVGNSASSAPFIVTLSPHQVTIPINSNYTLTMQCYNNGTIASVPSGQIFDGYFFVNYTSLNNGFHQTLVGDVAAKAT